jgi:5-formyltetrahydrofolate cyclo-ligase
MARRETFPEVRAAADTALREALRGVILSVLGKLPATVFAAGEPPVVASYAPIIGEPGGSALPAMLAEVKPRCRVLLPVVRPDLDLDWAEYTGPDSLRIGKMGVREPVGPPLGPGAIAEAALVIVPAVAVDLAGVRLGRGGGSYDRALARVPDNVEIIAPLYRGELFTRLPSEPHDRPVTTVLISDAAGTAARLASTRGPHRTDEPLSPFS